MAHAVSFPVRVPADHRGLTFWMKRTLEELAKLQSEIDSDNVHDLRVALRRCRSIAAALEEVDPHPDWEEMRDCARKLFRSLGDLRDAHVMVEWLNKLHPEDDLLKKRLLELLATAESTTQQKALHRAARFDQKRWKKLARSLNTRVRRVPPDGDAAHCLALERLEEARELHRRAMRTESVKPWHMLRIGVKRFRYTAESMLPTAHAEWSESLKRVQDVLGNIHDLDVLADLLKKARPEHSAELTEDWETRIDGERQENVQTYRQLSLGTASIWSTWLSGFPRENWELYAKARLRATRAATDAKTARSLVVTRLAMRIWSQLRRVKAGKIFSDGKERRVLEAAARLSGTRDPNAKTAREKSARTFLLKSPLPPRWSFAEWERMAWAIRFQRGAEPDRRNRRFSKLAAEQQARIRLLAGILRLAIEAQKCGVTASASVLLEPLPQGLLLHLRAVEDSPKNAARFTEAKRLLERSIGKTIFVQPEPNPDALKVREEPLEMPSVISIVQ
jgi:CHAD domain-containing protein